MVCKWSIQVIFFAEETMLFKKTINISELKANALEILGDLGDDGPREAIQLVHRGQSIKVIITQERYFRLMEAFESLRELEAHPAAEEVVNQLETLSGKLGLKSKTKMGPGAPRRGSR